MLARSALVTGLCPRSLLNCLAKFLAVLAFIISSQAAAGDGDISLYREVAAQVERGGPYHQAAAELHRENNYPLKPFVTVRSPALAYLNAFLTPAGMLVTAWLLLFMSLGAWWRTLLARPLFERAAVLGLIAAGGGAIITPGNLYIHELWAGLLITLALGLSWNRKLQLVAATCAVLLRELAAPILILLLYPFSWTQTRRVALALVIVTAFYIWHMMNVWAVLLPTDLPSQGWFGFLGLKGLSGYFAAMAGRDVPVWLALLPLLGWAFHRDRLPIAWCGGVVFAVCVLAREDNLFWILMMLPVYFAGPVFLVGQAIAFLSERFSNSGKEKLRPR